MRVGLSNNQNIPTFITTKLLFMEIGLLRNYKLDFGSINLYRGIISQNVILFLKIKTRICYEELQHNRK